MCKNELKAGRMFTADEKQLIVRAIEMLPSGLFMFAQQMAREGADTSQGSEFAKVLAEYTRAQDIINPQDGSECQLLEKLKAI